MSRAQLSEEQRAVVQSGDARFTVTAAAGAGKTFVLVERYLRHVVEEGLRPDEILTITFTKKAAAVMKRRIVDRLRDSGLDSEAQIAETGPIQTIHSFCERLLRENALEAGVDPTFEIMTESQSSQLVSACVREALASSLDDEPQAEALVASLTGKRPGFGPNRSPYGILEEAVQKVLRELRGGGIEADKIRAFHANPRALREKWEEVLVAELSPSVKEHFDASLIGPLSDRMTAAFKAAGQKAPPWLKGKWDPEAEAEALDQTCGLVQLACEAWWRVEREMNATQVLDFMALEERAVGLLARSKATRERLKRQIRVVMVDEAQDLNPVQYRLIQLLGADRLMQVGDAQQSIYGFRQADVELFQAQAGTDRLRLSRNYRSQPGILTFVDFIFASLWRNEYVAMSGGVDTSAAMDFDNVTTRDCSGVEVWRQARSDSNAVAAYVAELRAEGVDSREITVLVRDGKGAQAMEEGLRSAGIACRVAGGTERFYTRLEVRDLANALRAVADPYDNFSLLATLRSPLVGLSVDSVMLLGLQDPVVEHLALFEPPVPDDAPKILAFRAWYEPLRLIADRLAAWEVLADIFAHSGLLTALASREKPEQLLANVRKLLSLATLEPELGPLEYAERIREIQDLRHKEGDAPADEEDADLVTIMTIHKAKGLEFPVVVLPQTDERMVRNAQDLVIEPRFGLVATKYGKVACLMHRYLTERKKRRDEAEELRVLYVALTRAKSRLCLCIYPPKNYRTLSQTLQELMGDPPPSGVRVRNSHDPLATAAENPE